MSQDRRPVVLIFVGNYLPGHKAGGIIRTVANTVDHLADEFTFKVVTRDRDVGDDRPYEGIDFDRWHAVGRADVMYLEPQSCTLNGLSDLIRRIPHDALYLNSFFDPLTVKTLVNLKLGRIASPRVVVAPRGEFAWASLSQKYPKKYLFMIAARLFGLYRGITWHASSQFEANDIIRVMHADPRHVRVAFDFALKSGPPQPPSAARPRSTTDPLNIVFLSRIAREKNLDYALKVLSEVKSRVQFDIYGPAPDRDYWSDCQRLIAQLPPNVTANYRGAVEAGDVLSVFSKYDVFLFPTGGEAYGHVIVEALLAGTPVMSSTETPWRNLEAAGLGWDFDLSQPESFVDAIEAFAALSPEARFDARARVLDGVRQRLADPAIPDSHRQLFQRDSAVSG